MAFRRILFRFAKEADARFLSHRDLMRLFERALRRAALPVRMSQGFNPHPKMSIPAALPVGVEALDEALEIEFDAGLDAPEALDRLRRQMPRGVTLRSAEALPEGARARVEAMAYEADLPPGARVGPGDIERFLARESIPAQRSSGPQARTLDIRPALEAMSIEGGRLRFALRMLEGANPRASEVLAALLGDWPADAPLRRVAVDLVIALSGRPSGTDASNLDKDTANAP